MLEIQKRAGKRALPAATLRTYQRMYERVQSLYQRAETGHGRLAYRDVEQLDDVSLEYLALWLALLVMDDRAESVNLREVETQGGGARKGTGGPASRHRSAAIAEGAC
jgi:hypothetical protein